MALKRERKAWKAPVIKTVMTAAPLNLQCVTAQVECTLDGICAPSCGECPSGTC